MLTSLDERASSTVIDIDIDIDIPQVTFTLDTPVYHQGPIIWYLGKAPAGQTAASWDGSGNNWVKFKQVGPTFSNGASTWPMTGMFIRLAS